MADQTYLPVTIRDKFPKLSLRHVLLLQAHIRGFIVRSHMQRAREEFIELFNEIQLEEDDVCVLWKSQLPCLPSFKAAKEEKTKCLGSIPIQNPDGPREITVMESNLAKSKEDFQNLCSACDGVLLSIGSPQFPVKMPNEPTREDKEVNTGTLFSDDCKDSEKLPSEFESQVTNECYKKSTTIEQDSESAKPFVSSDEPQQKHSEIPFNEQECCKSPENGVCVVKDKANFSQDPNDEGKNIESTNSSLCLKSFGKEDRNESLTLDSSFTDVTSVWDSVQSLSPSVDIQCEIPSHETVANLQLQRQNIILELVWLKQAILSRKNYLHLKSQMDST